MAYLGTLWIIGVTAWLATVGWTRSADAGRDRPLRPAAVSGPDLCAAGAVPVLRRPVGGQRRRPGKGSPHLPPAALTDLRNDEIVLGKLLGSLLPIGLLLAATRAVADVAGAAGRHRSRIRCCRPSLIVAATALAAGSLGGLSPCGATARSSRWP